MEFLLYCFVFLNIITEATLATLSVHRHLLFIDTVLGVGRYGAGGGEEEEIHTR